MWHDEHRVSFRGCAAGEGIQGGCPTFESVWGLPKMPREIGRFLGLSGAFLRGWVPSGTAMVGSDAKFAIASSSLVLPMKASMPAAAISPTTS